MIDLPLHRGKVHTTSELPVLLKRSDQLLGFATTAENHDVEKLASAVVQTRPALGADVAGACEVASHLLSEALRQKQLRPVTLEGEIPLGPSEWLEHRVVIVELSDCWIVADLTAAQLAQFADAEFVVMVVRPNPQALRDALSTYYSWWHA